LFSAVAIDKRQYQTGAALGSTCIISAADTSPTLTNLIYINPGPVGGIMDGPIRSENNEIALLPSQTLSVGQTLANTSLFCALQWRERFLEESERT
jgi:hypothetical protein